MGEAFIGEDNSSFSASQILSRELKIAKSDLHASLEPAGFRMEDHVLENYDKLLAQVPLGDQSDNVGEQESISPLLFLHVSGTHGSQLCELCIRKETNL